MVFLGSKLCARDCVFVPNQGALDIGCRFLARVCTGAGKDLTYSGGSWSCRSRGLVKPLVYCFARDAQISGENLP